MKVEDFENEIEMLTDLQEREENDLGDKLFNLKKLVLFFFEARKNFNSVQDFCENFYKSASKRRILFIDIN